MQSCGPFYSRGVLCIVPNPTVTNVRSYCFKERKRANTRSNTASTMDSLLPAPLSNCDILNRILEFLGPRHTILSIGSINKSLRQLVQHDSLWRIFWLDRCCLTSNYDESSSSSSRYCCVGNLDGLLCQPSHDEGVHRAALTFRHAIHSLGLQSKFLANHRDDYELTVTNNNDDNFALKSTSAKSLYEGYIQTHTMMKLTNLRAKTLHDNSSSSPLQLCQQSCTQTWPGQLSLADNNHHNNNNNNNDDDDEVRPNTVVTCLNSAEVWCDHPTCKHARCGPNGVCLRAYRFLPSSSSVVVPQSVAVSPHNNRQRDMRTNVGDLNGPGDINGTWRQQQQHYAPTTTNDWNTNFLSFVKCNWCSVSYCNEHITNNVGGWYKCEECELSSCLSCTSQVFPSIMLCSNPPIQICNVMTAGKKCGRRICCNCVWFVGKECSSSSSSSEQQEEEESVIPGGKVSTDYNVVSIKAGGGGDDSVSSSSISNRERINKMIEKEMCCSKCLRHVEFRWRELSVVIDMFDGFVP